ncbi:MAG: CoA pyrophosphatase [Ekhidna sp.]
MNFDEPIYFLEKRLQAQMPGAKAHNRMKPRLPNGAPLRMKHDEKPREGGVLILFYEEHGQVRFPIIERPKYEGIHSGQMALPGGRREEEDRSLVETALRETHEEIGIRASEIEVIGSLSEFFVAASNYMVLPVIGKLKTAPQFTPDPREVADVVTPAITELVDPTNLKEKEMVVRNGFRMHCPYFDLSNRMVWGATAMMLSELVMVLDEMHT